MKRFAEISFSIVIIIFLAGILIATWWKPKEDFSYYENRTLAAVPEFSVDSFGNGSYFTDWETFFCDCAAFRTTILKVKTMADMHLFHRPVVNDVVVTDEEILLAYKDYSTVNESDILWNADQQGKQLQTLNAFVKSYGGTFLYVAVPSHYAYYEDRYPCYLNNLSEYTAAETDAFFSALDSYSVPYLDMGGIWKAEGNPVKYMSGVDHHYTWAGCYSAYQNVIQSLNTISDSNLHTLGMDEWMVNTLPNHYLGSRARKLCGQWNSTEKLIYAVPKTEIPFTRYNGADHIQVESTMFALPAAASDDVLYDMYTGGDMSEMIIQTNRSELPSLLIYGDSFTNAMETLLYTSFDEMRSLDLRYYEAKSLLDYVKEYQPEYVVCVRDYEQLLNADGNGQVTPQQ